MTLRSFLICPRGFEKIFSRPYSEHLVVQVAMENMQIYQRMMCCVFSGYSDILSSLMEDEATQNLLHPANQPHPPAQKMVREEALLQTPVAREGSE